MYSPAEQKSAGQLKILTGGALYTPALICRQDLMLDPVVKSQGLLSVAKSLRSLITSYLG